MGDGAKGQAANTVAIGKGVEAIGANSIAMGQSAIANSASAIAIGDGAQGPGANAVAVGKNTNAAGNAVALGTSADAAGNAVALGNTSSATGSSAAMGNNAVAGGASTIAIGSGSRTSGSNDIAMGTGAGVGTAGGAPSNLQHDRIAIGTNAGQNGAGNENIAVGYKAGNNVNGDGNVAMGSMAGAKVDGDNNTSIGYMANTEVDSFGNVISEIGSHSTAIGAETRAKAGATAVGDSAKATGQNSVAVGYGAKAEGASAIAIGQTAQATDNSIALGDASFANQSISNGTSYLTNVAAGSSGVVSVGSDTVKRRIVNVADGSQGNDAVNVNQLKAAQQSVANFIGGGVTLNANGTYSTITLLDTSNVPHTYSTLAAALGAVTNQQIQVATADSVTYTDGTKTSIDINNATINNVGNATLGHQAVNLGQMNTAIEASRIKYYSVNSTISANRDNSGAAGLNAMAIGPAAKAEGEQSISIGINTKSEGRNSIVIGNANSPTDTKQAVAYNESGIAIGTAASSKGEHSIAFGYYAETQPQNSDLTSHDAIAIGTKAQATADRGVALGKEAVASAEDAFAQGSKANATGEQSIAVGTDSKVKGSKSMAVGSKNTVDGASSGAFGTTMDGGNGAANNVSGSNTYVVGNANGSVSANNSSIIGNENKLGDSYLGTDGLRHGVPADKVGILGSDNKVTASESSVIGYNNTLGKEGTNTYNFAVRSGVMGSNNTVTGDGNRVIGNDNNDGDKSSVFILGNSVTAGLANSVYLGDSSSYVVAGTTTSGNQAYGSLTVDTKTYTFAGATPAGVVTVGGINSERRIQNVAAGLVTAGSTDAVNGSQLYALTRPLGFQGDTGTEVKRGSDQTLGVVGGATGTLTTGNIGVVSDAATNKLTIKLSENLTGLNSIKFKTGSVELNAGGLNNGGNKITNVATGTAGSDAVNVDQLNTAAAKATTTVSAGSNITVTPTTAGDGHKDYNVKLNDTVTLGTAGNQVTIDGTTGTISAGTGTNQVLFNGVTGQGSVGKVNINGSVGRVGGLTNTDWGPGYTMVSGQAATEDQLKKVDDKVLQGLNFEGNEGGSINRQLGEKLNIVGGATTLDDSTTYQNIKTVKNGTDTLEIQLEDDLKLDSVTTGNTVMNTSGITITGGANGPVSLTNAGLNNGNNKIINVAAGTNATDAVNLSQLQNATAGAKTTVSAGSNINVTKNDGVGGNPDDYEVSLKDTVTLGTDPSKQITIDGTTGQITSGAVTINTGGNGTINNLTNTDWGPGYTVVSGQAATEDQLQKATQGLTNAGLNFAGNTGSTNKKLGETMTIQGGYTGTAASDENVKTVVNADGTMSIQLAKDAKFDSVTTGDTVINNNGLTINQGGGKVIKITKGDINMGDNIIHGVADGVDGKDAVNKDQLDTAAAAAKTTVSQGSNITVTSTTDPDDGHTDYNVKLNDTVVLGSGVNQVTMDGTTGTITAGDKFAVNGVTGMGNIGNIQFDGSGSVGEIKGLTNTTIVSGVTGEGARAGVAATEGQLKALNNIIDGGLNFAGDDYNSTDPNTVINKKLGQQLNIVGGETDLGGGDTAKNIRTAKNAAGDLEIILNDELELNKVTMGNTYLDESGLYFGGYGDTNVYITKAGGLHNGGHTITGVGDGVNDDDAVNMSQLKDAAAAAKTSVSNTDGNITINKTTDPVDGHTDYELGLGDKINIGDGSESGGKSTGITIDGKKGEIGGLSNTEFVDGTTGVGDRAGVAATEGQLKDMYDDLDGKIEQNTTDITNIKNEITDIQGDITDIQGDITTIQGDMIKGGAITDDGKINLYKDSDYEVDDEGNKTLKDDATPIKLDGTLSDESLQAGNDDGNGNYKANDAGTVTMKVKDKYSGAERDVTIADVASKAKFDDLTGAVGVVSKEDMKDKYKETNYIKDADDMAGADIILDREIKNNSDRLDQQGNQINNLNNSVNRLGNRVDKVGAGAAALAALHPLDFDPDEKLTFAAGVGNYRGETAASIGAFYRPDEKVMLSLGGTVGNGENMVNMGVSFALDRTSNVNNSKVALAKEVVDLRKQVADLTLLVMQNVGQGRENLDVNRLFPDVAENHWAYEYVADLAKQGIIEGYPDGNFGGDRMMTRYEFAAMLYRAMEKGANVDSKIINEFEAELGRIRVDRISGQDDDKHKVERVRVNGGKTRDKYGSEIAAQ